MPRKSERIEDKAAKTEENKGLLLRSRKRKADVAICLQDFDEVTEAQTKKTFDTQACWNTDPNCTSPCRLIPTPQKHPDGVATLNTDSCVQYRFKNVFVTPTRASPLPILGWANRDEVWNNLVKKDQTYLRDKDVLQKHPLLQPKMRAILLDWLMEVCEVYKLHRETLYLAQDFFDRFMATQQNVVKTRLQLIGISALFIAAKLEEIYPPKLHQFAYVTDGACTEDEILDTELIILKALKWSLCPITIVSWLNIYMQVAYLKEMYEVLVPQYPQEVFVQIMELLDLCILDLKCLEFTYGLIAASALYHFSSCEVICKVSGFEWNEIEACVKWMVPFAMALREVGSTKLKKLKDIAVEDVHNIQTHSNSLFLLDKAQEKQALLSELSRTSPVPSGVLTPPQSSKKPILDARLQ
ncbi:G1/S-specific cyclin-E1 [Callorhinchus milii]|uniref:G1/S-specific cyclin-E1 n=1 Tax=Callorhinchus milii TaxID=7868 RepID=V9KNT0_CALMI|nr:G1/S-specific cyclin-E1 [Callorhinchus milii]XP_007887580.2 G1/S-specific cyclin-E1 [Callorhinchus milii]